MKRIICIILTICMIVSICNLSIPVTAEDKSEYGKIECSFLDSDKTMTVDTNVTNNVLYIDAQDMANLLSYTCDKGENGCSITNTADGNRVIFLKDSKEVIYFNKEILKYTMPYTPIVTETEFWIPFTYTLNIFNINITPKDDSILLSSNPYTLFDVMRKIAKSGGKYSISLDTIYGDNNFSNGVLISSSVVSNYLNDVLDTFGINHIEIIANGFAMDTKYANQLCQLFDINSQSESAYLTDAISIGEDLFLESGGLSDIAEDVLEKTDDPDNFKKICTEIRKGMEANSGFRNTREGNRVYKNLTNNIRDSKAAHFIEDFQDEMPSEIKKLSDKNGAKIKGICYGIQVMDYMNDFTNQDSFSIDALDFFLNTGSHENAIGENGAGMMKLTNQGLKTNITAYSLGQTVYDIYASEIGDIAEDYVISGDVQAAVVKLSWSIMKTFVPFIKDGLSYTDSIQLFVYASSLGANAQTTYQDYANTHPLDINSDYTDIDTLFHYAQLYYTYLKWCYIARETALDGLQLKAKSKLNGISEEDIKPLIDEQTAINEEIAEMMAVLKLASPDDISDTSCYGFLPCTDVTFDDTEYIELISKGSSGTNTTNSSPDSVEFLEAFDREYGDKNALYYLVDDYDGNETLEAFVITGERDEEGECVNVTVYYVDHNGEITPVTNDEELSGELMTEGWFNEDMAEMNGSVFHAGNQKFIVWDYSAWTSQSTSCIFGVKDNIPYEPAVSRQYESFWANSSDYSDYLISTFNLEDGQYDFSKGDYVGIVSTQSSGHHTWYPEFFTFEEASGEFLISDRTSSSNDYYDDESYDLSECLGANIHETSEMFSDMEMQEARLGGIQYSNGSVIFDSQDEETIDFITYNTALDGYTLMGLSPGMYYDEADSILSDFGELVFHQGDYYKYSLENGYVCHFGVNGDMLINVGAGKDYD